MTSFFLKVCETFNIISVLYCDVNINMIYCVQTRKESVNV